MREKDIQSAIMAELAIHPFVAWAFVTTTGKIKTGRYWITVGYPGMADIIGQMKSGAVLAIEVKRNGEIPTPIQTSFLETVRRFGGVSGWCDSVEGALKIVECT